MNTGQKNRRLVENSQNGWSAGPLRGSAAAEAAGDPIAEGCSPRDPRAIPAFVEARFGSSTHRGRHSAPERTRHRLRLALVALLVAALVVGALVALGRIPLPVEVGGGLADGTGSVGLTDVVDEFEPREHLSVGIDGLEGAWSTPAGRRTDHAAAPGPHHRAGRW